MNATANQLPPADVADARTNVAEPPVPLLRGVLHLAVAVVAPLGLVLLIRIADSPRRYAAAAIFGTSLILLYATSASYHIVPWPGRRSEIMARVDHSNEIPQPRVRRRPRFAHTAVSRSGRDP